MKLISLKRLHKQLGYQDKKQPDQGWSQLTLVMSWEFH